MTPTPPRALAPPEHRERDMPAPPGAAIEIRDVRTQEEFAACVRLQEETWGDSFSERVPAALLKVTQRIGGITAGAFDATGRLVGFVFGITGVERGDLVHWSDMLAVHPAARDHGLGRRLKLYQRDRLILLGVKRVYWTFDPLVARNAHLNLNRLGARVVEYVPDMYGAETDSPLHRGLGTDRFVVAWHLAPGRPGVDEGQEDPARRLPGADGAPVLNAPGAPAADRCPPLARVEIPAAIHEVQEASVEEAARWRAGTRRAFLDALGRGYEVAGFYRDGARGRCFYVLANAPDAARGGG